MSIASFDRSIRKPSATRRAEAAENGYVSVTEAANYLGVTTVTIREMLRDGRLQGWTLGPRVLRIRRAELDTALEPWGGGDAR